MTQIIRVFQGQCQRGIVPAQPNNNLEQDYSKPGICCLRNVSDAQLKTKYEQLLRKRPER